MEHGTLLAGRYEVLEPLGRGGMGEVWAARDQVLQRQVALKLLPMDEDAPDDLSARFEREAVAAAQINHPNVVALYDRGVHDDTLFLIMELVEGMPLSTLIESSGVLPLARALELAEQICSALAATHQAGVVHFDIKPRNVMITAAGSAKVVDFGIAGFLRARLSVVASSRLAPAATLEYAAPEQFTAERGDARSDVYALGGVLFAMLTGHAPFTGHSGWEVMAAKVGGDAPRLDRARPGLPPGLTDLVAGLLERDPARRPQSAREVRERLARLRAEFADATYPGTTIVEEPAALPPAPRTPTANTGGPRQLPPDTGLFTGRETELRALFAQAEQARTRGVPGTVVISAIDGMGGVGKTTLAVHAAHRLARQFPDGQLFLDLYGHARNTPPREPGDALAALLSSMGVPPRAIPADVGARAALYRSRLADTRTLILLDNAVSEDQVRPLIPAAETCLVLVTSRRRLKALDDAWPLALDLLPPGEAVALLSRAARLNTAPVERELLDRVAALCGHLPLALVIAASLVRTGGPDWSLERVAERLADRLGSSDLAAFGDDSRSLSAVFDLSYLALSPERRALYRRLALIPGPGVDAYAAAALLDADPQEAGKLLEALEEHSLLTESTPGRYRAHDLIRAHARTLAAQLDPASGQAAAVDRLLGYYAHTAQSASIPIARRPRTAPEGPAPAHSPALTDPDAARAWLRAEYHNLDAAHTYARGHDRADHAVALAAGMAEILLTDGPWEHALDLHQNAVDTAERQGRPAAAADALTELGRVRAVAGDLPGAIGSVQRSLELHRESGHSLGHANALNDLGRMRFSTGDYPADVEAQSQALEIYRELGERLGQANALSELGRAREQVGDLPGAADAATQCFEIYRELGHRLGQAHALNDLGRVREWTGDFSGAGEAQSQALQIYREIGNRLGQAAALNDLGRLHQLAGDYPAAIDAASQSLDIVRQLGHRYSQANALVDLGRALRMVGDLPRAADAAREALKITRETDNRLGEAIALAEVGRVRQLTGDSRGAIAELARSLEIFREIGSRGGESWALNHYAAALAAAGENARALALYEEALAMNRELNKPDDEAISLEGIAEHHLASGDAQQAAEHFDQALEIYRRLGAAADAERVESRLRPSSR
ncbi:tetratricopeptide repeat protein [Actinospica sp.]|uniref:tetratricopeptide repeat protein n=1 Tax=Actinospica sp. TaxID=1872142 RepID=UPI002B9A5874|nr:tetratricopeptide repeat protein [Actinospica sp.]HWG24097.1 tetratricopeptide repeat protein [Actinospica sp.]